MTWSLVYNTGKFATSDGTYIYCTAAGYIIMIDPSDDSATEIGEPSDFDSRGLKV